MTNETAGAAGTLGRRIAGQIGGLTLEKVTEAGFANARANGARIAEGKSIAALMDLPIAGRDALIVAAGPSIHRQDTAKIIRDSGFDGTLVATDSAMSWCLRHGFVPDLVVTLDPHARRIVRWFGDPDLNERLIAEDDYYARQDMDPRFRHDQLQFNREMLDLINKYGPRLRIAVSSSAPEAVVRRATESGMDMYWWNPMYDDYDAENSLTRRIYEMNGLPCLNAGGNVGSACWVMAHAILGAPRVALLGMDFGYYDDTPYGQTQYYKEILSLVGPDRLDEVYVRMFNPHAGREFYTDPAYLWFRQSFLEMVQTSECETHNCTGGGILFGDGIRANTLEQFVKEVHRG